MLNDLQTQFSDAQVVTATAISTNVIDTFTNGLNNTLRDLGADDGIWLNILVGTAVTAAGAATVVFSLESDSTADLATSATVHLSTAAIGKAALTAGSVVASIALPRSATYERFLGVRYTVATGPLLTGTFTAVISGAPYAYKSYRPNHRVA
jgi:hypothetical protein